MYISEKEVNTFLFFWPLTFFLEGISLLVCFYTQRTYRPQNGQ